jgi:uncharacterized protein YidB (DUF937 family)
MDFFDVLDSPLGSALAVDPAAVLEQASRLIDQHPGGLQGLLDQFRAAGLSAQVSSWVGPGSNLPVTGAQLQSALGAAPVAALAAQLGVSPDAAASHLASFLPGLIDHATPDGEVGSADLLQRGLAAFRSKLFG